MFKKLLSVQNNQNNQSENKAIVDFYSMLQPVMTCTQIHNELVRDVLILVLVTVKHFCHY